ncbi:MAG TPA: glycosyltransferase [Candidatus Binatia bacterium]|nr:glycosyltransferase [Candidatus Binatia bacterium]
MKILVLTKRQYMAKDLLDDRFGRFRELPLGLARLGHEVRGLALSYRPRPEGLFVDEGGSPVERVQWTSVNLLRGYMPQPEKYLRRARELSREFAPDVIWACSDAYHAIFGNGLARSAGIRCVIDLYDHFEAFAASRVPGILPLFRRAVLNADGVTVFSDRLANYVAKNYARTKPTTVIQNGVREDLFRPRDKKTCRQSFGLPEDAKIIGTAGALEPGRSIGTLFEAFRTLSAHSDNIHLALAGPRPDGLAIPCGSRVHDYGELRHEEVATLLNALDVAVVCYRPSAQGEVSLPQKVYEIVACRVPLVAAAVGSMNELLKDYPACLYEPDHPTSLADAIRGQLDLPAIVETPMPSWSDSAKRLSDFFHRIVEDHASSANILS